MKLEDALLFWQELNKGPYPDPQAISCYLPLCIYIFKVVFSLYLFQLLIQHIQGYPPCLKILSPQECGIMLSVGTHVKMAYYCRDIKKISTPKNQNFCTNSICVLLFPILLWLNYDYYQWLTVLWSGNYLYLWCSKVQYSLHNSRSLDTILSKTICLRFCLSFHNIVGYIFCGEGMLTPPKPPAWKTTPWSLVYVADLEYSQLPSNHNLRPFHVSWWQVF